MRKFLPFIIGIFVLSSSFILIPLTSWKIEKNHLISFDSPDASGIFGSITGTVIFYSNNLNQSKFDVKIPVESIDTDNFLKNRHAKSAKWFDAEKYPNITYKSSQILKTQSGYMVRGTLTIRDISKPVTIPFKFNPKGKIATFDASFVVNRMDFQIGKAGDIVDDITLKISIPVKK